MALPDRLAGLLQPSAYPHPCGEIVLIETHISWVILTGSFAYKLKKPVRFNFVDFSDLDRREHFCREELRCNRAFAPDLYLSVVAIVAAESGIGSARVAAQGTDAEVLEWAVQMRQFDPEQGLDRLLERGELDADQLHGFGAALAARHAALPVHRGRSAEVATRIFGPVEDNFREIDGTGLASPHRALIDQLTTASRALGEALRPRFEERLEGGFIRECHGDLHLSNLALIDGEVTAFDCLEFNENLRWIDTMSDVAFLLMDCHVRGELALAYAFLDGYLDACGDYAGSLLLDYFAAYRSVVRAKVAALRWEQEQSQQAADRFVEHLEWARARLSRPSGTLILTCGLSGSGKSYLAGRLARQLPALRLRSDVARKKLAGLGVLEGSRSPTAGGLYSAAQSDRTFAWLAELAGQLVQAGEHVIIDATFIERSRRQQFLTLGEEVGAQVRILYCDAPATTLEARLRQRAAAGGDPSEATLEVLEAQRRRFEPPGPEERALSVDMGQPLGQEVVDGLVAELLSPRGR